MKSFRPVLLLTFFAATFLCAFRGASAQVGVYAEFSGTRLNIPLTSWVYGPTFGAYYQTKRFGALRPGIDARGGVMIGKANTVYSDGMVGPRLAFHPRVIPITPYVEGVFGIGHVTYGLGNPLTTVTKFEYDVLGGADLTLMPHLDWRVIEFSYGSLSALGSTIHPKIVSTGIVFRLK